MRKMIGAVSFVWILLVIAGIEQNPGPRDKFNFRYQYLLIEVGTKVAREIFDVKVGHNLGAYLALAANKTHSDKLQFLITGKKGTKQVTKPTITSEQAKLLPPQVNYPSSSTFDITLLTCLLRNICGLLHATDNVWVNPAPTDVSTEADITRLRQCRNELMHGNTVCWSETEFDDKWKDLVKVLTRLNTIGGIGNLSSLINDALKVELDENLKARYDAIVKEWSEMDSVLDKLQEEVASLQRSQSEMDDRIGAVERQQDVHTEEIRGTKNKLETVIQTQQDSKRQCKDEITNIQQKLMEMYLHDCSTLPLSPVFEDEDDNLLKIYQYPSMRCVDYNKVESQDDQTEVTSYKGIFHNRDKPCQNIYMTGDAGTGKTSFCKRMCLVWCMAKRGDKAERSSGISQIDLQCMNNFDLVFYVSLRETDCRHVIDMIIQQLFDTESRDMYTSIEAILRKHRCLILLDGLDEWSPETIGKVKCDIPKSLHSEMCTYFTTCRPYRIESPRLSQKDINNHVKIFGLQGDSSVKHIKHIINYMNEVNKTSKTDTMFMREVHDCGLQNHLCIPILASNLVLIWFDKPLTAMSRAAVYCNSLEMMFKRAEKRGVAAPHTLSSDLQLPIQISNFEYINKYASLIDKIGLLAFNALFKQTENAATLIFTKEQLESEPFHLSGYEQKFLCEVGFMSKNKIVGCSSKQTLKVSFIHKSYLEFFGALFLSKSNSLEDVFEKLNCLFDYKRYENFILLLAGMDKMKVKALFDYVFTNMSGELTFLRRSLLYFTMLDSSRDAIFALQTLVFNCYREISKTDPTHIVLKHEDVICYQQSDFDIVKLHISLNRECLKSIVFSCSDFRFFVPNREIPMLHLPELPWRSFHQLTTLCLNNVEIPHNRLHDLVEFLSGHVVLEHLMLENVYCTDHEAGNSICKPTLNLLNHSKLVILHLRMVNILCNGINSSCLQTLIVCPMVDNIVGGYSDMLNSIKESHLIEKLEIDLHRLLDSKTIVDTLMSVLRTLPCIKYLTLMNMNLPDDVVLNPDAKLNDVELWWIDMSRKSLRSFIDSLVKQQCEINVTINFCKLYDVDGESHTYLTEIQFMYDMCIYVAAIPNTHINKLSGETCEFEITTSC